MVDISETIEAALQESEEATKLCCIMYGGHLQYADVGGQSVGDIRSVFRVMFNIPDEASATIKGERVDEPTVLLPGQTISFTKESGNKGLGDLLTPKELMDRWQLKKGDYQDLLDLGLPSIRLNSGLFHPEMAVDEWMRRMGADSAGQGVGIASLDRIARQGGEKNGSPYLDAERAAAYLGITVKSLYGLVERRQLVPLRASKRRYRFTEDMLDQYLRRKEGGT